MNPETAWFLMRFLPSFLLGAGCAAVVIAAVLESRREREMEITRYVKRDGQLVEMERRRVAESGAFHG